MDLNLLLVFDAIMSERNVTRAGQKIGMSQPAVSNALNRLRHHLKDELFVRGIKGMQPSPRAMELAAPVRNALENLEDALAPASFNPQTTDRTFCIGTNDYTVSTLMPAVAARLQKEAPGIGVRLVSSAGNTFAMLDAGEIDFGISAFKTIPERFHSTLLLEDIYVLVMRRGHPLAQKDFSLERYAASRHLMVSPRGEDHSFVDLALAERGLSRRVQFTVNNFASAPSLLQNTDLILTTPRRIAETFAGRYDLVVQPAPFTGPPEYSSATLVWHNRSGSHPAHVWFRQFLEEVADTLR